MDGFWYTLLGIPLSVGETVRIKLDGEILIYKLVNKTTDLAIDGEEQLVSTGYVFELEK
jgi:hypothetical protein